MAISETVISGLQASIRNLEAETQALRLLFEGVKEKTEHHERILVTGDNNRLPLAETVRNLTATVTAYIEQKNKEEEARKAQWDKLKWVIIAPVVLAILTFVGQAIVFYFRIYPLLDKLSQ